MNEIRRLFLESSTVAREVLADPAVQAAWDRPSALELWKVSGLAGHLSRATTSVEAYLDRPDPGPERVAINPVLYYNAAVGDDGDLESELHRAIRARGDEAAAGGHAAVLEGWDACLQRLETRLDAEPAGKRVQVFKDMVLTLDDYLVTRLIETLVHTDDLAVSVGIPTPPMPLRARDLAIETLVGVARLRHGDLAVLRALARRERDAVKALHVL